MEWRQRGEVCKENGAGDVSSGVEEVSMGGEAAALVVLLK